MFIHLPVYSVEFTVVKHYTRNTSSKTKTISQPSRGDNIELTKTL